MRPPVQVKDLPLELQEAAHARVRRGLPAPRPFVPLCPHPEDTHVTEADGTVWCPICTADAEKADGS